MFNKQFESAEITFSSYVLFKGFSVWITENVQCPNYS